MSIVPPTIRIKRVRREDPSVVAEKYIYRKFNKLIDLGYDHFRESPWENKKPIQVKITIRKSWDTEECERHITNLIEQNTNKSNNDDDNNSGNWTFSAERVEGETGRWIISLQWCIDIPFVPYCCYNEDVEAVWL